MKSHHNCFKCIIKLHDEIIHDKEYKTLKDISEDIGLTYNMVADISCNRKKQTKYKNFIYMPDISIMRLKNI